MSQAKIDFEKHMQRVAANSKKKLDNHLEGLLLDSERAEATPVSQYAHMISKIFSDKKGHIHKKFITELDQYNQEKNYATAAGTIVGAILGTKATATQKWLTALTQGASLAGGAVAGAITGAVMSRMLFNHLRSKEMYNDDKYENFEEDLKKMGIHKQMEELSQELVQLCYFREQMFSGNNVSVNSVSENFRQQLISKIQTENDAKLRTEITLAHPNMTTDEIEKEVKKGRKKIDDVDVQAAVEAHFIHGLNSIFSRAFQSIYDIKQDKIDSAAHGSFWQQVKAKFGKFWNREEWQRSSTDLQVMFMNNTVEYLKLQNAEQRTVAEHSNIAGGAAGLTTGAVATSVFGAAWIPTIAMGLVGAFVVKKVLETDYVKYEHNQGNREGVKNVIELIEQEENRLSEIIKEIEKTKTEDIKLIGELSKVSSQIPIFRSLFKQDKVLSGSASAWLLDYAARYSHSQQIEIDLGSEIKKIEEAERKQNEVLVGELSKLEDSSIKLMKFPSPISEAALKNHNPPITEPTLIKSGDEYYFFNNNVLSDKLDKSTVEAAKLAFSQPKEVVLGIKPDGKVKVLRSETDVVGDFKKISPFQVQEIKPDIKLDKIKFAKPTLFKHGENYYISLDGKSHQKIDAQVVKDANIHFSRVSYKEQPEIFHAIVAKVENFPSHPELSKYIADTKKWLENSENADFIKTFNIVEKMRQQVLEIAANHKGLPKALVDFYISKLGGTREELSLAQELESEKKRTVAIDEIPILQHADKFDEKLRQAQNPYILAGASNYREMIALDKNPSKVLQGKQITDSELEACLQHSFDFLYSLNQPATGDQNSLIQNSQEFIVYKFLLLQQLAELYDINNQSPKLNFDQRNMINDFVEKKLGVDPKMFRQMSFQKLFIPEVPARPVESSEKFKGRRVERIQLAHMDELLRTTLADDTKPKKVSELLEDARKVFSGRLKIPKVSDLLSGDREHPIIQEKTEKDDDYLKRIEQAIDVNSEFIHDLKKRKSPIVQPYVKTVCANIDVLIKDIKANGKECIKSIKLLEEYKQDLVAGRPPRSRSSFGFEQQSTDMGVSNQIFKGLVKQTLTPVSDEAELSEDEDENDDYTAYEEEEDRSLLLV